MKITVITTCLNEEKNIEKTIRSVLLQTSTQMEYVICDGQSTDDTLKIAKSYEEAFSKKGIVYRIDSQKDTGIYDGMNKGIFLATGDYIVFLNAGDLFHSADVIEKSITLMEKNPQVDIFYGKVMTFDQGLCSISGGNHEKLTHHSSIPHQSVFARTALMKENPFDTRYRIASDYKFLLSQKIDNRVFMDTGIIVADYDTNGVSSTNLGEMFSEFDAVKAEFGFAPTIEPKVLKKMILNNRLRRKLPHLYRFWMILSKQKRKYHSFIEGNK